MNEKPAKILPKLPNGPGGERETFKEGIVGVAVAGGASQSEAESSQSGAHSNGNGKANQESQANQEVAGTGSSQDSAELMPVESLRLKTGGLVGVKKGRYNRFIPREPLLRSKKDKRRFLDILNSPKAEGYLVYAAEEFGCHYETVRRRMKADAEFAEAANAIRHLFEQQDLAAIEKVSVRNARSDKGNTMSERALQLNALNPEKYRPHQGRQPQTSINVTFGFQIPKVPTELDPAREVKAGKGRGG